jgi:hypothetical protein
VLQGLIGHTARDAANAKDDTMAGFGTKDDFARMTEVSEATEAKRHAELASHQQTAIDDALELGGDLFEALTALPAALIRAQRIEIKRLAAADTEHPRIAQTKGELESLLDSAPMAARVRARAARALELVRSSSRGFNGFVTTADGEPLPGVIVRLSGVGTEPHARTEEDGYFHIALPSAPAADMARGTWTVSIAGASGDVLYEDPIPLNAIGGFAYREYVVESGTTRNRSDR